MRQLRHARILFDITLVLGLIVSTGIFVLAARLAQGPIRLASLRPYVEQALNPAGQPFTVILGEAGLAWNARELAFDIRADDVQIFGTDQALKVRLPELSIRISLTALLEGRLAPSSIGIEGARLHVVRREDNTFDLDLGTETGDSDGVMPALLADLLGQGDGRASALTRVTITKGALVVEDRARGAAWAAQGVNIDLRRGSEGIAIAAAATVEAGGLGGKITVAGYYDPARGGARLNLSFAGLAPRLLAMIEPQLSELERIDLLLGGTLSLAFDRSFLPVGARLDLRGGAGMIFAREFYADPVPVTGIGLRAEVVDGFTRLLVEDARIERGETILRVSGWAQRRGGVLGLDLDAEVTAMPINEMADLWPVGVAPNARNWTTSNIRDGRVVSATVHLAGSGPADTPAELKVSDVHGRIEAQGVSVHYLRPMRPVVGVDGVAEFDRQHFLIRTKGGSIGAIKIEKGQVELLNLDQRDRERAKIVTTVSGLTREALTLIDEKPLGFAHAIGLKPAAAAGTHVTEVTLELPLSLNLPLADLTVRADARLSGFAMPDVAFGHAVDKGELRALVDKEHIELTGGLRLAGTQFDVRYTRAFAAKATVQQKVSATGLLGPESLAQLGIDVSPYMSGAVNAAIDYEERVNAVGVGAVTLDLAPAQLTEPLTDWKKPAGMPGKASFRFETRAGRLVRVPAFAADGEGLSIKGAASFRDKKGEQSLAQLDLDHLVLGATDMHAKLVRADDDAWSISLGGTRLDVAAVLAKAKAAPAAEADKAGAGLSQLPPLQIEIAADAPLGELRVSDVASIHALSGSAAYDGTRWTPVMLEGKIGSGAIHVQVADAGDGRRLLIDAEDAAAAIGLIGISEGLAEGELKIVGRYDDKDAAQPLEGRIAIAKLRVTKASTLAQILTLASLTGIGNTLSGRGVEFEAVVVPFHLTDAAVVIKDARVVGSALGISGSGRIDRKAETIAFEGELVPAYTLNNLVSRVPILGRLLTGGADGLFAATYRVEGPLADPKVSVNPLSVLTPGFARVIIEQLTAPTPIEGVPPAGPTRREE